VGMAITNVEQMDILVALCFTRVNVVDHCIYDFSGMCVRVCVCVCMVCGVSSLFCQR